MGMMKKKWLECCTCIDCPCPCCPDCWRRVISSVTGILVATAGEGGTDCGKPPGEGSDYLQEIGFSCVDLISAANNTYSVFVALSLSVRLYCDMANSNWKVEYKSDATNQVWTDTGVTFICPSCGDEPAGSLVTGEFSFVAYDACDTSGGPVIFPWNITITITVECG